MLHPLNKLNLSSFQADFQKGKSVCGDYSSFSHSAFGHTFFFLIRFPFNY